jgi:hypothetical protein
MLQLFFNDDFMVRCNTFWPVPPSQQIKKAGFLNRGLEGFTGYFQTIRISLSLPQPKLEEQLRVAAIEKSK